MTVIISDPSYTLHDTGFRHIEQPDRITAIDNALSKAGLKTLSNTIAPRVATEKELLLCHSQTYIDLVKSEIQQLDKLSNIKTLSTGDVNISSQSYKVALLAVGGVLKGIDEVMSKKNTTAFCVVRPPGHHACSSEGMGFCLFNNVSIGARYAQDKYGVKRILIADWDVHHGNGTQEIFYNDPSVFYFSTHEEGNYPNTGFADETGEGAGKGYTLNIPIKKGLESRKDVIRAFEIDLCERMKIFKPNLVIISAGFDAHKFDPLGHFNLTDEDFYQLTTLMKSIADKYAQGRLVSVLEGGYDLEALASASVFHVKALRGIPLDIAQR